MSRLTAIICFFAIFLIVTLAWATNHYRLNASEYKKLRDEALEKAESSEAITANVIQTVNLINTITEANQNAKQQIALESQRAENDIKTAVADDDCAVRVVPPGAVKRLHEYADGLRAGSGGSVTSQPDG